MKVLGRLMEEGKIGLMAREITLPINGVIAKGEKYVLIAHGQEGIEIIPTNKLFTREMIYSLEKALISDSENNRTTQLKMSVAEDFTEPWTEGQLLIENAEDILDKIAKIEKMLKEVPFEKLEEALDETTMNIFEYEVTGGEEE